MLISGILTLFIFCVFGFLAHLDLALVATTIAVGITLLYNFDNFITRFKERKEVPLLIKEWISTACGVIGDIFIIVGLGSITTGFWAILCYIIGAAGLVACGILAFFNVKKVKEIKQGK